MTLLGFKTILHKKCRSGKKFLDAGPMSSKMKTNFKKSVIWLCFFWRYVEPPKLHEGLPLIHQNRKFCTIDNRDRCPVFNNWRQNTLYDNVHVSQRRIQTFPWGGACFISETIFFRNIKRYRDVIQSENYKTW